MPSSDHFGAMYRLLKMQAIFQSYLTGKGSLVRFIFTPCVMVSGTIQDIISQNEQVFRSTFPQTRPILRSPLDFEAAEDCVQSAEQLLESFSSTFSATYLGVC
jgi:hypothetical protein